MRGKEIRRRIPEFDVEKRLGPKLQVRDLDTVVIPEAAVNPKELRIGSGISQPLKLNINPLFEEAPSIEIVPSKSFPFTGLANLLDGVFAFLRSVAFLPYSMAMPSFLPWDPGSGDDTGTDRQVVQANPAGSQALALPKEVEDTLSQFAIAVDSFPVGAVRALATKSPALAMSVAQNIVAANLSTDPRKAADHIKALGFLSQADSPQERLNMLLQLVEYFFEYDETKKAASAEEVRNVRFQVVATLKRFGVRDSFVKDIETFVGGDENQKSIAIQSLTTALSDGQWDSDIDLRFAANFVVKMVLSEIDRGTSKPMFESSIACVAALAKAIVTIGMVPEFVKALVTRSSRKDPEKEDSAIYSGLSALMGAGKDETVNALMGMLKDSMFSPTDILVYRLVARNLDDPQKKFDLTLQMIDDLVSQHSLTPLMRQSLRNVILTGGHEALRSVLFALSYPAPHTRLTEEKKADLLKLADEIAQKGGYTAEDVAMLDNYLRLYVGSPAMLKLTATLGVLRQPGINLHVKQRAYESVADLLYDEFRGDRALLAGFNSLERVGADDILTFYQRKSSSAAGSDSLRSIFYLGLMIGKIGEMEKAQEVRSGQVHWALVQAYNLFARLGNDHFGMLLSLLGSSAVSQVYIKEIYKKISAMQDDVDLPDRQLDLLIAMSGNYGLPRDFLVNTVGAGLLQELDRSSRKGGTTALQSAVTERKMKVSSATERFPLEKEHREGLQRFAEASNEKYRFDPASDSLTVHGVVTVEEFWAIMEILKVLTHHEKYSLSKEKRDEKVGSRMLPLQRLSDSSKEAARKLSETNRDYKEKGKTVDVDASIAVELLKAPPLESFKKVVEGLVRLSGNPGLSTEEKNSFVIKLMELHDKALEVGDEEWSFAVILPLARLFFSGKLERSGHSLQSRVIKFILDNGLKGMLKALSIGELIKLFTSHIDAINSDPSVMEYVALSVALSIAKTPHEPHLAEKAFVNFVIANKFVSPDNAKMLRQIVPAETAIQLR